MGSGPGGVDEPVGVFPLGAGTLLAGLLVYVSPGALLSALGGILGSLALLAGLALLALPSVSVCLFGGPGGLCFLREFHL